MEFLFHTVVKFKTCIRDFTLPFYLNNKAFRLLSLSSTLTKGWAFSCGMLQIACPLTALHNPPPVPYLLCSPTHAWRSGFESLLILPVLTIQAYQGDNKGWISFPVLQNRQPVQPWKITLCSSVWLQCCPWLSHHSCCWLLFGCPAKKSCTSQLQVS